MPATAYAVVCTAITRKKLDLCEHCYRPLPSSASNQLSRSGCLARDRNTDRSKGKQKSGAIGDEARTSLPAAGFYQCEMHSRCRAVYCSAECRQADYGIGPQSELSADEEAELSQGNCDRRGPDNAGFETRAGGKHWLFCWSPMVAAYTRKMTDSEEQEQTLGRGGSPWALAATTLAVMISRAEDRLRRNCVGGADVTAAEALSSEWHYLMNSLGNPAAYYSSSSSSGSATHANIVPEGGNGDDHSKDEADEDEDEDEEDSFALIVQGMLLAERRQVLTPDMRAEAEAFFCFARWQELWRCMRYHGMHVYADAPLVTSARSLFQGHITAAERTALIDSLSDSLDINTDAFADIPVASSHVDGSGSSGADSDTEGAMIRRERRCLHLAQAASDGRLAAAVGHVQLAALMLHMPPHSCAPTHSLEISAVGNATSIDIAGTGTDAGAGAGSRECDIRLQPIGASTIETNADDSKHIQTVSWDASCDASIGYEERQRHLRGRFGAAFVCLCDLCLYEQQRLLSERAARQKGAGRGIFRGNASESSADGKGESASNLSGQANPNPNVLEGKDLKPLSYTYMRALKFPQATRALVQQVRRHPSDGDAWHALGASLLSSTALQWPRAHVVWRQGAERCPQHVLLAQTVAKIDAYAHAVSTAEAAMDTSSINRSYFHAGDISTVLGGRAGLSAKAILSEQSCAKAIAAAEAHAALTDTGWTTSRHYAVPTTDIPVHAVPALMDWFSLYLLPAVIPMLKTMFFHKTAKMRCCIHDAFVVKYQAEAGQRGLPLHSDESTHSLTVALNPHRDYTGGGTYFAELNDVIRPKQGQVLAFDGNLVHAGDAVLSGTRYILAIFLLLVDEGESVPAEWIDVLSTAPVGDVETEAANRCGSVGRDGDRDRDESSGGVSGDTKRPRPNETTASASTSTSASVGASCSDSGMFAFSF